MMIIGDPFSDANKQKRLNVLTTRGSPSIVPKRACVL